MFGFLFLSSLFAENQNYDIKALCHIHVLCTVDPCIAQLSDKNMQLPRRPVYAYTCISIWNILGVAEQIPDLIDILFLINNYSFKSDFII